MTSDRQNGQSDGRDSRDAAPAPQRGSAHNVGPAIPLLEWLVAGVGATLLSATLIFITVRGCTQDASPPDISIRADAIVQVEHGFLLNIRAANRGTRTAADVKVEGELKSGSRVIETAETTFKYLPANSERSGGLFFSNDPRTHELTLRPKGFEKP